MPRRIFLFAIILEVLGVAITGTGVGVELATGAGIGYILITGGSCLIAGGGIVFAKFLKRG